MKKLFIAILSLAVGYTASAQAGHSEHDGHNHGKAVPVVAEDGPLKVNSTSHDFGKIPQGKPVYYEFEITNTGTTPLKLDNVTATCGCTTPEWSKDPIAPAGKAKIKVGYNAAAESTFDKPITILYNNNQTIQLKITGYVWKAPAGPAPANASVDLLKKQTF